MPGYSIEKAARLLEWERVQQRLAELATSSQGAARCRNLPLYDDPALLRTMSAEATEARSLLERDVEVRFMELVDLNVIARRARIGSALDGADLLTVAQMLTLSRRIRRLLEAEQDRLPLLARHAGALLEAATLEKEITGKIERDGRVADNASRELAQLRDRYRAIHDRIHATLEAMIAAHEYEDILQEDFFTLRNGRFVLPVRVDRKSSIDGIVHDVSNTGQSVFIEPRKITDLNNNLRTAEIEIDREIHRILLELTYKVGEVIDELETAAETLAGLDVIFAKARYSIALQAHAVEPAAGGGVHLPQARHPLLVEQLPEVIANDIELEDLRTLVLSGPNTGGKTVLLKTVGLCALMLRAGLHLPCGPDGRLPVFKRIFAVIGDEQSLEHNLSSFSSHLLNLKYIVDELVPGSLVLIDEMGEGTDPTQGVALAKAILEKLHAGGARTLVTTHFSALMADAQIREGWANAAMTFDEKTMTPTFHLHPGAPGRSSAFAVAQRLGLPADLVERARQYASGSDSQLEAVITRLENERQKLLDETRRTEAISAETAEVLAKEKKILADLREKKAKLAQEEREKIMTVIAEARKTVKQVVRDLRAQPSDAAAETARAVLKKAENRIAEALPRPEAPPLPADIFPVGDWDDLEDNARLVIPGITEEAFLLDRPDNHGQVRVLVKDKKITLAAEQCFRRAAAPPAKSPSPGGGITLSQDEIEDGFLRLDLRGHTADDALLETERFLDVASRQRIPSVVIIHGHGTGVLKRTVRDYLRRCPYARSWRPGERGEGGDGVSVVELDL